TYLENGGGRRRGPDFGRVIPARSQALPNRRLTALLFLAGLLFGWLPGGLLRRFFGHFLGGLLRRGFLGRFFRSLFRRFLRCGGLGRGRFRRFRRCSGLRGLRTSPSAATGASGWLPALKVDVHLGGFALDVQVVVAHFAAARQIVVGHSHC